MQKQTLTQLKKYKANGQRFATLTAYDSTFARLSEAAGIECLLVGDSLGNVIQGQRSTVPVTLGDMCYHTQCVSRATNNAFIMADMPYMSYANPDQAISNATALMQAGAQMVKMEGGAWLEQTICLMSERGIPVCAHLGLLPQSTDKLGGYRMQGKSKDSADQMLRNAKNLEQAGADILLLECVPAKLAADITKAVSIPVIGIGAGPDTDSQVLVVYDALGLSSRLPSFSKNFMEQAESISGALVTYATQVKDGQFPGQEFTIG